MIDWLQSIEGLEFSTQEENGLLVAHGGERGDAKTTLAAWVALAARWPDLKAGGRFAPKTLEGMLHGIPTLDDYGKRPHFELAAPLIAMNLPPPAHPALTTIARSGNSGPDMRTDVSKPPIGVHREHRVGACEQLLALVYVAAGPDGTGTVLIEALDPVLQETVDDPRFPAARRGVERANHSFPVSPAAVIMAQHVAIQTAEVAALLRSHKLKGTPAGRAAHRQIAHHRALPLLVNDVTYGFAQARGRRPAGTWHPGLDGEFMNWLITKVRRPAAARAFVDTTEAAEQFGRFWHSDGYPVARDARDAVMDGELEPKQLDAGVVRVRKLQLAVPGRDAPVGIDLLVIDGDTRAAWAINPETDKKAARRLGALLLRHERTRAAREQAFSRLLDDYDAFKIALTSDGQRRCWRALIAAGSAQRAVDARLGERDG